jgi:hypothetical protein
MEVVWNYGYQVADTVAQEVRISVGSSYTMCANTLYQ